MSLQVLNSYEVVEHLNEGNDLDKSEHAPDVVLGVVREELAETLLLGVFEDFVQDYHALDQDQGVVDH